MDAAHRFALGVRDRSGRRDALGRNSIRSVEPEDGSIVRFRSGTRYTYVAIRRGGVWHTSSREGQPRAADEAISEFAWNPINKVETWPDLVARGNTFAAAVGWASAPALLKRELAVFGSCWTTVRSGMSGSRGAGVVVLDGRQQHVQRR